MLKATGGGFGGIRVSFDGDMAIIEDLEAKGQLSASRAGAILATATEVDVQLGPEATTTTTTTTTSTTPPPAKGKGHGKDKGNSGD